MSKRGKQIKKLEKRLAQKSAANRDWISAYFDARAEYVRTVNKQELTVEIFAQLLKALQES